MGEGRKSDIDSGQSQDQAGETSRYAVTVSEAAKRLGVKEDTVRKRLQRGTLSYHKDSRGRVQVHLTPEQYVSEDQPQDVQDGIPRQSQDEKDAALSPLVESLQDQVAYLREQLDAERQARTEERRRADTVIAQLTSRIPQLEAPQEPHNQAESAENRSDRVETPEESGEAQRPAERRSWWRRMWGR